MLHGFVKGPAFLISTHLGLLFAVSYVVTFLANVFDSPTATQSLLDGAIETRHICGLAYIWRTRSTVSDVLPYILSSSGTASTYQSYASSASSVVSATLRGRTAASAAGGGSTTLSSGASSWASFLAPLTSSLKNQAEEEDISGGTDNFNSGASSGRSTRKIKHQNESSDASSGLARAISLLLETANDPVAAAPGNTRSAGALLSFPPLLNMTGLVQGLPVRFQELPPEASRDNRQDPESIADVMEHLFPPRGQKRRLFQRDVFSSVEDSGLAGDADGGSMNDSTAKRRGAPEDLPGGAVNTNATAGTTAAHNYTPSNDTKDRRIGTRTPETIEQTTSALFDLDEDDSESSETEALFDRMLARAQRKPVERRTNKSSARQLGATTDDDGYYPPTFDLDPEDQESLQQLLAEQGELPANYRTSMQQLLRSAASTSSSGRSSSSSSNINSEGRGGSYDCFSRATKRPQPDLCEAICGMYVDLSELSTNNGNASAGGAGLYKKFPFSRPLFSLCHHTTHLLLGFGLLALAARVEMARITGQAHLQDTFWRPISKTVLSFWLYVFGESVLRFSFLEKTIVPVLGNSKSWTLFSVFAIEVQQAGFFFACVTCAFVFFVSFGFVLARVYQAVAGSVRFLLRLLRFLCFHTTLDARKFVSKPADNEKDVCAICLCTLHPEDDDIAQPVCTPADDDHVPAASSSHPGAGLRARLTQRYLKPIGEARGNTASVLRVGSRTMGGLQHDAEHLLGRDLNADRASNGGLPQADPDGYDEEADVDGDYGREPDFSDGPAVLLRHYLSRFVRYIGRRIDLLSRRHGDGNLLDDNFSEEYSAYYARSTTYKDDLLEQDTDPYFLSSNCNYNSSGPQQQARSTKNKCSTISQVRQRFAALIWPHLELISGEMNDAEANEADEPRADAEVLAQTQNSSTSNRGILSVSRAFPQYRTAFETQPYRKQNALLQLNKCNHMFHLGCLSECYKGAKYRNRSSCPLCRTVNERTAWRTETLFWEKPSMNTELSQAAVRSAYGATTTTSNANDLLDPTTTGAAATTTMLNNARNRSTAAAVVNTAFFQSSIRYTMRFLRELMDFLGQEVDFLYLGLLLYLFLIAFSTTILLEFFVYAVTGFAEVLRQCHLLLEVAYQHHDNLHRAHHSTVATASNTLRRSGIMEHTRGHSKNPVTGLHQEAAARPHDAAQIELRVKNSQDVHLQVGISNEAIPIVPSDNFGTSASSSSGSSITRNSGPKTELLTSLKQDLNEAKSGIIMPGTSRSNKAYLSSAKLHGREAGDRLMSHWQTLEPIVEESEKNDPAANIPDDVLEKKLPVDEITSTAEVVDNYNNIDASSDSLVIEDISTPEAKVSSDFSAYYLLDGDADPSILPGEALDRAYEALTGPETTTASPAHDQRSSTSTDEILPVEGEGVPAGEKKIDALDGRNNLNHFATPGSVPLEDNPAPEASLQEFPQDHNISDQVIVQAEPPPEDTGVMTARDFRLLKAQRQIAESMHQIEIQRRAHDVENDQKSHIIPEEAVTEHEDLVPGEVHAYTTNPGVATTVSPPSTAGPDALTWLLPLLVREMVNTTALFVAQHPQREQQAQQPLLEQHQTPVAQIYHTASAHHEQEHYDAYAQVARELQPDYDYYVGSSSTTGGISSNESGGPRTFIFDYAYTSASNGPQLPDQLAARARLRFWLVSNLTKSQLFCLFLTPATFLLAFLLLYEYRSLLEWIGRRCAFWYLRFFGERWTVRVRPADQQALHMNLPPAAPAANAQSVVDVDPPAGGTTTTSPSTGVVGQPFAAGSTSAAPQGHLHAGAGAGAGDGPGLLGSPLSAHAINPPAGPQPQQDDTEAFLDNVVFAAEDAEQGAPSEEDSSSLMFVLAEMSDMTDLTDDDDTNQNGQPANLQNGGNAGDGNNGANNQGAAQQVVQVSLQNFLIVFVVAPILNCACEGARLFYAHVLQKLFNWALQAGKEVLHEAVTAANAEVLPAYFSAKKAAKLIRRSVRPQLDSLQVHPRLKTQLSTTTAASIIFDGREIAGQRNERGTSPAAQMVDTSPLQDHRFVPRNLLLVARKLPATVTYPGVDATRSPNDKPEHDVEINAPSDDEVVSDAPSEEAESEVSVSNLPSFHPAAVLRRRRESTFGSDRRRWQKRITTLKQQNERQLQRVRSTSCSSSNSSGNKRSPNKASSEDHQQELLASATRGVNQRQTPLGKAEQPWDNAAAEDHFSTGSPLVDHVVCRLRQLAKATAFVWHYCTVLTFLLLLKLLHLVCIQFVLVEVLLRFPMWIFGASPAALPRSWTRLPKRSVQIEYYPESDTEGDLFPQEDTQKRINEDHNAGVGSENAEMQPPEASITTTATLLSVLWRCVLPVLRFGIADAFESFIPDDNVENCSDQMANQSRSSSSSSREQSLSPDHSPSDICRTCDDDEQPQRTSADSGEIADDAMLGDEDEAQEPDDPAASPPENRPRSPLLVALGRWLRFCRGLFCPRRSLSELLGRSNASQHQLILFPLGRAAHDPANFIEVVFMRASALQLTFSRRVFLSLLLSYPLAYCMVRWYAWTHLVYILLLLFPLLPLPTLSVAGLFSDS
ncbi:unnamed protein product [Amoebophrya sp. A120]|nr:unnamed protein product [Amoebophrya sp. A120]|eukprot:GSA120T00002075001.1